MHFSAAKSRETTDSVSFEFADMLTQVLLFTVATCNALVVPARAPAPRMGLSKGDDFPKAALRNIGVQVSAAATHPLAQSLRLGSPTRDHAFPTHALRQLACGLAQRPTLPTSHPPHQPTLPTSPPSHPPTLPLSLPEQELGHLLLRRRLSAFVLEGDRGFRREPLRVPFCWCDCGGRAQREGRHPRG